MTATIGLTEARERLTEILERVVHGEQLVVTRYGSPVAAIVPVPDELDGDPPMGLGAFAGGIALYFLLRRNLAAGVGGAAALLLAAQLVAG